MRRVLEGRAVVRPVARPRRVSVSPEQATAIAQSDRVLALGAIGGEWRAGLPAAVAVALAARSVQSAK